MADEPPRRELPERFTIPYQVLDEWMKIPMSEYVELRITRNDLDNFFLSLIDLIKSQDHFHAAMIQYTNNNVGNANEQFQAAQSRLIDSENKLRQFMTAAMVSATRGR